MQTCAFPMRQENKEREKKFEIGHAQSKPSWNSRYIDNYYLHPFPFRLSSPRTGPHRLPQSQIPATPSPPLIRHSARITNPKPPSKPMLSSPSFSFMLPPSLSHTHTHTQPPGTSTHPGLTWPDTEAPGMRPAERGGEGVGNYA